MRKGSELSFSACMKMMRRRNPQMQEDGFHALLHRASEFVEDLTREFLLEKHDHGLRCWLLELIGEAADARALELLVDQLNSDDAALQTWAIYGLRKLNTVEAREALFKAGVPFRPPRATPPERCERRARP